MGLFSDKTKVYVSSVVYNLGGPEADRPNFLRSTMASSLLAPGSDKRSRGADLIRSYMTGPAMRQRDFYRWAKTQFPLGSPEVEIVGGQSTGGVDFSPHIPVPSGSTAEAQSASLESADFFYWAERYILESRPADINGNWTCDIDGNQVIIEFENGTTVSIPATSPTYSKTADYLYIHYTLWTGTTGVARLYIYRIGSGNAVLDNLASSAGAPPEFLPYIPLRLDNRSIRHANHADIFEDCSRAYRKAAGGNRRIDELLDKIEDNDSIEDIDYAFLVYGVVLNSESPEGKRYIYEFFRRLIPYQNWGRVDYEAWEADAVYEAQAGGDINSEPAVTKIRLKSSELSAYDMRISWISIDETVHQGVGKTGAKAGDVWFGEPSRVTYYTKRRVTQGSDDVITEYSRNAFDVYELFHQVDADSYRRLYLRGVQHHNYVYEGKAVLLDIRKALAESDPSGFVIPIHYPTLRAMGLKDATELAVGDALLILNCYEEVTTRWYESGLFRIILAVTVAVVFAFAFPGAVGLLGANAAVGASLGFTGAAALVAGAIANAVAAMALVTLIETGATALFGEELGALIAVIASFVAFQFVGNHVVTGSWSMNWGDMMRAENLLKLTDATGRTTRAPSQQIGDVSLDVLSGIMATAGGVVANEAGKLNAGWGTALAEKTQAAVETLQGYQSEEIQGRQDNQARLDRQDQADTARQYRSETSIFEGGHTFSDDLRKIGRDALNKVENLKNDPAVAASVVGQGVGSLVVSAPAARAAQIASRGTALAGAGVPLMVGEMEASGVYAQTVGEVMGMSETELSSSSQEYRGLRAEGVSHEEARQQVANQAGLTAARVQLPVAAVTGKFVERFEAAPLNSGSFTQSLRNIGSQTIEEAVQSGTGQVSSNVGMQVADADRALSEGVGGAMVEGAVGGAGMAGVVQAPAAARATAAAAARGATGAVRARLNSVEASRDETAETGTRATQEAGAKLTESLTRLEAEVSAPQDNPETSADPAPVLERIQAALTITGPEVNDTPEAVRRAVANGETLADDLVVNRTDVVTGTLAALTDGKVAEADQADVALWLHEQAQALEALRGQDVSSFGAGAQAAIDEAVSAAETILGNDKLVAMLDRARSLTSEDLGPLPEITETNLDSPEVQQAIRQQVALAQSNPAGVDPAFVNQLLDQRARGGLGNLRDQLVRRLQAAAMIATGAKKAAEAKAAIETAAEAVVRAQPNGGQTAKIRKSRDIVRQEVLDLGRDTQKGQWGLSRHLSEIVTALGQGRTDEAQIHLDRLRSFGEHMQDKVRAAKESVAEGKGRKVPYRTWDGGVMLEADHARANSIYVNSKSPNSLVSGREAVVDAETVAALYNNLVTIYGGQLSGEALPALDVPDILRATQTQSQNTPTPQAEAAPQPQAQPEATAEPAADNDETSTKSATEADANEDIALIEEDDTDGPVTGVPAADDGATPGSPEDPAGTEGGDAEGDTGSGDAADDAVAKAVDAPDGDADAAGSEPAAGDAPDLSFANLGERFRKAFRFDATKAPFLAAESPVGQVISVLKSIIQYEGELSADYRINAVKARLLGELIEAEGGQVLEKMNARLASMPKERRSPFGTGSQREKNRVDMTPLEAITASAEGGRDWLGVKEGKALNVVDPATGRYDPKLAETAVLAGFHWLMNAPRSDSTDIEDVARAFNVDEGDVEPWMIRAMQQGLRANTAAESLARAILEFWGAEIAPDAPLSDSLGIAQAMAAEVLTAMEGRLVTEHARYIHKESGNLLSAAQAAALLGNAYKTFITIELSHKETAEQVRNIGGMKAVLSDAFLPKTEKAVWFDEVPAEIRKTQKGNMLGRLGGKMRRALGKHQQITFRRNTPFLQLIQAMGEDAYMALMGAQAVEEGRINKVDALSVEGLNTSIRHSWDGVLAHNEKLEAYAEKTGKAANEVATHFDWYTVSNERIHAEGFNPQADKTMREAFVTTVSPLDLTTPKGRDLFWLTVAQSIGVKTEKLTRKAAVAEAQKRVGEKYQGSMEALETWLEAGGELSAEAWDTIASELGTATPKLLHGILAVARFNLAMAEGGEAQSAFQHSLALEADGKTDGPINAMVHFLSGAFSWDQVRNMAKGGFFLGSGAKTLNAHMAEDSADLYQTAAGLLHDRLAERRNELTGNEVAGPKMTALLGLMNDLSAKGDFSFNAETGEIEIGRGTLKNPLTITVYGSGTRGIAGKVANGLMEVVYARLSNQAQDGGTEFPESFFGQLKELTESRVYYHKGEWHSSTTVGRGKLAKGSRLGDLNDAEGFEFRSENRQMLMENILSLFVGPMDSAIVEMMGDTRETLQLFQSASQVQSAILVERFRQTVQDLLAEKRAAGELGRGDFLSKADYDRIFRDLARYGVVIEGIDNDAHHLNLASKASVPSEHEFFQSLDGRFDGNAALAQPTDAGVRAMPLLTISRGDAAMMVNFFASNQVPDDLRLRTLPVFDGLEMPADAIDAISKMINHSVAEAWLENPAQDVADSFSDWLRQGEKGPLDGIDFGNKELQRKLTRLLKLKDGEAETQGMVQAYADHLRGGIVETARSIQARKNVYKRVGFSVDHMASGESPYVQDGETIEGDLVDGLNALYEEELAKLEAAADEQTARPAVAGPSKAFQEKIARLGTEMQDGVVRLGVKAAMELVADEGAVGGVARAIGKALPDFSFFFGEAPALTALRNQINPELQGARPVELGQTDLAGGAIYIANASAETVVHEMLHAATAKVIAAYHTDPESLGDVERNAVENLQKLMTQFMDMTFEGESPATAEAARRLAAEIAAAMASGDVRGRSRALHEFVAWTLSNQNLGDVLKKSRVRTPLKALAFRALGYIRRLFGLRPDQRMDMFSNIAMNANVLLAGNGISNPWLTGETATLLNQSAGRASDPRIARLMGEFDRKIASHLRTREAQINPAETARAQAVADRAVNRLAGSGFALDPEQVSAFRSVQAALATSMEFDAKALTRVQRLFEYVTKKLTVKSFMQNPDLDDPADRARANERFRAVLGREGYETDLAGRSNLMASFLALSQVSPEFRAVLNKVEAPKDRSFDGSSVDDALSSLAESTMNTLATTIAGEGLGQKSLVASLDRLAGVLGRVEADDRSMLEKQAHGLLGSADGAVRGFLSKGAERLTGFATSAIEKERTEGHRRNRAALAKGARLLAGLIDESKGKAVAKDLTTFANTSESIPRTVLEMLEDVMGITDDSRGVYELVNRVKYAVSGVRQDHREALPEILAEQFSRKLSKEEWTRLYALGKTDIAALVGWRSLGAIRKLLTGETDLAAEITTAETGFHTLELEKAKALAKFMVRGEIDPAQDGKLLRNAYAIVKHGLRDTAIKPVEFSENRVQAMEAVIALYALRELDDGTREVLKGLAEGEAKGMDFLVAYLAYLRGKEAAKAMSQGEIARLNGWAGHIPAETRAGAKLIVQDDSEQKRLESLGYTRLGTYQGSGAERGKRGYYFSTVAGSNTYHQGVMQTVQKSAFGVDPRNGRTLGGFTAGRVPDEMVAVIRNRLQANQGRRTGEPLLPIVNEEGEVVAYERSMAPERLAALDRNTHLGEMIGAWAGRQAEEELAEGFNRLLVDRSWDVWEKARKEGKAGEFVDLSGKDLAKTDPVLADAWKLVPAETRDYIAEKFGDAGFQVRKNMLNNTVGYREASVADVWTGVSRLDEKHRKAVVDAVTVVMGKNAFPWLVRAEKGWQAAVSVAKNTIVIRSVIVPASNIASNVLQLMTNGVGARDIVKGFGSKLVEIDQHLKRQARRVEIKALMARHLGDPLQTAKLETEMKSLDDADRRMSIWPLIEAGEFSTISEGLTEADAAIGQGKWVEWMQAKIDQLPTQLGTAGRYAVISRDTALFKGMARSVQYGDFLAKAVLYDHLTKREKASAEETKEQASERAMKRVSEEFVNYNLLPGRVRSYAESMGLTWFWAFKIRSLKIAHRHMRDNPVRALLATVGMGYLPDLPGIGVGAPITDNGLAAAIDGRLDYSIGPGMLFSAPSLNPWVNLST